MNASSEVFDRQARAWSAWQETPWARLRYRLVHRVLTDLVTRLGPECSVLDVGGGDGRDVLPLAALGHRVTILDHSTRLLEGARAAAARAGASSRVRTLRADFGCLEAPDKSVFDLVLCHNVLQYLDDVPAAVRALAGAARPGGVLSLLAPNRSMDVLAAAVREQDPARALDRLHAATIRSETFDHEMRRVDASTVEEALTSAGCVVTARLGIRCVMDLIADEDLKRDPAFFADLERLEVELCDRDPYRAGARYWQVLATRAASAE